MDVVVVLLLVGECLCWWMLLCEVLMGVIVLVDVVLVCWC